MNRPDELNHCLESVFQSAEKPDEVIVSDDSPDNQPVQAVITQYPGVIYQPGPRRGLSANRNACIRSATSSHIIFIDDDVCVPSAFFTVARKLITSSDPKTVITGYEMNHGREERWQGEGQKIVPHNADFWGLQRVPVNDDYRSIVINSTIFPRTLFEQAQFDEHLRYGSEEIDMARHAISLGYRIVYQDALYVHHYPSSINREQYQRFVHASRLYATTKAYWQYEQSFIKTFAYLLLAPLQLVGSTVRKGDLNTSWRAIQAIAIAGRYLVTSTPSLP
ncbi:MAG: glycosyltransferase [Cyanobacteria bacterium CRU_2_1]|nr:glycosyltransferase [Cyanobacteria bacterium RU_5_0]NJR60476.1 glycosyltransferase [Cyanobacteria bacterium CRU_2_1]